MSNIFDQMEADFENKLASSVEKLDQSDLTTVAGLAKAIRDQEEAIAALEADLKQAKKSLMKMTDEDLPTMLAEIGLSSMTLDDGSEVSVKQTYGASILVDNRPKAYQWLRETDLATSSRIPSHARLAWAKTKRLSSSVRLRKSVAILPSRIRLCTRLLYELGLKSAWKTGTTSLWSFSVHM